MDSRESQGAGHEPHDLSQCDVNRACVGLETDEPCHERCVRQEATRWLWQGRDIEA
jgi:hypothetical protein